MEQWEVRYMKKNVRSVLVTLSAVMLASCSAKVSNDKVSASDTNSSMSEPVEDNKVHITVLAGQSGARGKALVSDLSDEQNKVNDQVDIIADGLMMPALDNIPFTIDANATIQPLRPGYGDTETEFGPELGIGETLASRYTKGNKSRKSLIVKYTACGSTFLSDWYSKSALADKDISGVFNRKQIRTDKNGDSQGPLTNNLFQLIDKAESLLKEEGYEYVIDGVIFSHGEQDAKFDVNMSIYQKTLKYFIKDVRSYVGNDSLPFVITEAITNAAKYSNRLREIQSLVAKEDDHIYFVSRDGLYTNTFEPWHARAESNFDMGNRAAAELVALNDNRKITSFLAQESYQVPLNGNVPLPKYLKANFSNGRTGTIKVTYPEGYDCTRKGIQDVKVRAETNMGTFDAAIQVDVTDMPYVDGILTDWPSSAKKTPIGTLGTVSFACDDDYLYIGADIKDKEIWTDGEAWSTGDMGQGGSNDDLRIYVAGEDIDNVILIALSSDNILRVYEPGITDPRTANANANYVFRKLLNNPFRYHVTTTGVTNVAGGGEGCTGMKMELAIAFDDLNVDKDTCRLIVDYNNISSDGTRKSSQDIFVAKKDSATPYTDFSAYYSLSELL